MPYISKPARQDLLAIVNEMDKAFKLSRVRHPGELNYLVTVLTHKYLEYNGLTYHNVNDAIGALECAKLELYRRKVAAYEDTKVEENGDV